MTTDSLKSYFPRFNTLLCGMPDKELDRCCRQFRAYNRLGLSPHEDAFLATMVYQAAIFAEAARRDIDESRETLEDWEDDLKLHVAQIRNYPDVTDKVIENFHATVCTSTISLLLEAGEALYGSQWQSPIARDLNVADRTVRRWIAGESPIPDGISEDVKNLVTSRITVLSRVMDRFADESADT